MCKSSEQHAFLAALPKVEHHIHLEGALSPELLFKLAEKNQIPLPTDDPSFASIESLKLRYTRFTCLDDFLNYYYICMNALITEDDFEMLAWDYFTRAKSDGVHHVEAFFDPQAHLSRGVAYATIVDGLNAARSRAESELGITSLLTSCYLRHLPVHESVATFKSPEVQEHYKNGSVIGVGLCSSENNPPTLWSEIFQEASSIGLKLTAHAGEEGPAEYLANALDHLGVTRIDHGIRLGLDHDPDLMKRVVDNNILLTVCPVSNVVLRCVPHISHVPIRKFIDAGVKFSVNSDDPAYFGAYILDCFCAVQETFDLSRKEWETITTNSIEHSWCSADRKSDLLDALSVVMNTHGARDITLN
ncbi:adenine deaminase/adenosine deaminase [Eremomyces bilateralis CBS 781.70]|uniref:Adenine deaminase n=1 Tax=Eremomyces bilateralis CBS 781.70 TaxID=1392243 RepID=A0A6G1G0W0_9PEZI|nr:adenine deaminase/adenosine deaminase [Eremomyces bilateralis CBS 781.70]KAF1811747.1 adenine deaminase/adenosine deaminase [Eremomyces bilateralis CBS 781.70]